MMMRNLIYLVAFICCLTGTVRAEIGRNPDHTLLCNTFRAVRTVGDHAVAINNDGVAVLQWDSGHQQYGLLDCMLLDDVPRQMRLFDQTLIVKTLHDSLILIDLRKLPKLERIGALHPGTEFADYAFANGDVYITVWFDGVRRFTSKGGGSYSFADSSMKPILVTKLEAKADTLFVLDEYNGLARFDISGPGFGVFLDYLWVPFRTYSVKPISDRFLFAGLPDGVFVGEYGRVGSGIVDTVGLMPGPQYIHVTDSLIVLVNNRMALIRHRQSFDSLGAVPLGENGIDGDIALLDGDHRLLLPGADGGLVLYSLDHLADPQVVYNRPGPITGLLLLDGRFVTAGAGNPIDVYSLRATAAPQLDYTLFGTLANVQGMDRNGDTLIVLYGGINKLTFVTRATDPDSSYIESSIFVDPLEAKRVEYVPDWLGDLTGVLIIGKHRLGAYTISESSAVEFGATWNAVGEIDDAVVKDSLLFVASDKRQIMIYRIADDLSLQYLSSKVLASAVTEMKIIGDRLVYFAGDSVTWLDFSDPYFPQVDTTIALALPVKQAAVRGSTMYTVGLDGAAIYDFSEGYPILVDYGGRGGSMITADSDYVVTSTGNSIYVYVVSRPVNPTSPVPAVFTLSQNYPNPFNAVTTIEFTLPRPALVSIVVVNILGQRVVSLLDEYRVAGQHFVQWDGVSGDGSAVASGVYFYRLESGEMRSTRKMLLIK
ncbi:MAG: T9SS type A sorting domain-containing protein [bacterium]